MASPSDRPAEEEHAGAGSRPARHRHGPPAGPSASRCRQSPGRFPVASGSAQYSSRLARRAVGSADEVQRAVRREAAHRRFAARAGSRFPGLPSGRRPRRRSPPGSGRARPPSRLRTAGRARRCRSRSRRCRSRRAGRPRSGRSRPYRRRPTGTCPRARCSRRSTAVQERSAASVNSPRTPFASRVAFQTVLVGLPSGPDAAGHDDPVADRDRRSAGSRLGQGRGAAPRPPASPCTRLSTRPGRSVSGSSPIDQTVSVGSPSGPFAADQVGRAAEDRDARRWRAPRAAPGPPTRRRCCPRRSCATYVVADGVRAVLPPMYSRFVPSCAAGALGPCLRKGSLGRRRLPRQDGAAGDGAGHRRRRSPAGRG